MYGGVYTALWGQGIYFKGNSMDNL